MSDDTTLKTSNIDVSDLWVMLKALEIASSKKTFNDLEQFALRPSFDRVHTFLKNYQESLANQGKGEGISTEPESVECDSFDITTEQKGE